MKKKDLRSLNVTKIVCNSTHDFVEFMVDLWPNYKFIIGEVRKKVDHDFFDKSDGDKRAILGIYVRSHPNEEYLIDSVKSGKLPV